jgi:hypothetical protein
MSAQDTEYFSAIKMLIASDKTFLKVKDTKGVIRIRKSKKDRQCNGQKKEDKRTNNDLQNIT